MKNKTSFIIIGAAGFLGSAMTVYLRRCGYTVFEIFKGQISGIESDFNFLSGLLNTGGKQVVIDFSYTSVPNSSFQDPVKDYSENLYNVLRHLEFVRQLPESTYVYISSGGTVYGNPLTDGLVDENHPNTPLSPYGITKLSCEKYVLMYKEVHGMKIKILRPSNIFGPGQKPFRGQGLVATAIAKMLRGEPIQVFGNGMQVRDYLYVDDFCSALHDIVSYGEEDVYNVGSETGYSINDLLAKIEKHLGISSFIEHLPGRPFDVRSNILDSSKVKALQRWMPEVSIDEGLEKNIAWLKEQSF